MRIDPTNLTSSTSTTTSPTALTGKDEFLRLFVAQLQNQDPLSPQEGAEFVAQLAQFASVEQQTLTNDRLDALASSQDAVARSELINLVGKEVEASGRTFTAAGEGAPALAVRLEGAARTVDVIIRDANGQVVKKLSYGAQAQGDMNLAWDGRDANGNTLARGTYSVEVQAKSAQGSTVTASPLIRGRVDAVDFTGGVANVRVGGALLSPTSITKVAG